MTQTFAWPSKKLKWQNESTQIWAPIVIIGTHFPVSDEILEITERKFRKTMSKNQFDWRDYRVICRFSRLGCLL